jgi:hypothetical protein
MPATTRFFLIAVALLMATPASLYADPKPTVKERDVYPMLVWTYENRVFTLIQTEIGAQNAAWDVPDQDSPLYRPLDYPDSWEARLPEKKLGTFRVGDRLQLVDRPGSCVILSFVVLARGIPHFGELQDDETGDPVRIKGPRCGLNELFAELECKDGVGALVHPPGSRTGITTLKKENKGAKTVARHGLSQFRKTNYFVQTRASGNKEAAARKKKLKTTYETQLFRDPISGDRYLRTAARFLAPAHRAGGASDEELEKFDERIYAWWKIAKGQEKIVLWVEPTWLSSDGATGIAIFSEERHNAPLLVGKPKRFCFIKKEETGRDYIPSWGVISMNCRTENGTMESVSETRSDYCDCDQ